MAELKVTTESLEAALEFLSSCGKHTTHEALMRLLVPREAGEGWVMDRDVSHELTFLKPGYMLSWLKNLHPQWRLYKEHTAANPFATKDSPRSASTEAQAWADREIEKREAWEEAKQAGNGRCPICGFKLPCPMCEGLIKQSQPAPTGPGSRFRMPGGDIVMVLKDQGEYAAVSTTGSFLYFHPKRWYFSADDLRKALEAVGAKRIPEVDDG